MDKHPIESLMTTTMENIRDMIDVNTIIGEPIATECVKKGMTFLMIYK